MAGLGKIYNIDAKEPESGTIPLLKPQKLGPYFPCNWYNIEFGVWCDYGKFL